MNLCSNLLGTHLLTQNQLDINNCQDLSRRLKLCSKLVINQDSGIPPPAIKILFLLEALIKNSYQLLSRDTKQFDVQNS